MTEQYSENEGIIQNTHIHPYYHTQFLNSNKK